MTVTCLKSPINTTICLFWSYYTLKDSFPMVLQLELLFWLIFSRVVYIYVQWDMFEELYLRVFVFEVSFLCIQVATLFYSYETVLQIVNISSEYLHAAIWYFLPLNLRIFLSCLLRVSECFCCIRILMFESMQSLWLGGYQKKIQHMFFLHFVAILFSCWHI